MTDNTAISVTPFLTVSNAKKAVDFYMAAFGANELKRYEMPAGKIQSKMSIGNALFYVGDEEPENGNLSPATNSNSPVRIILQTTTADNLYEQAIKLGATSICPMTTETDWRIGKLQDPFGHTWEIGYTL